MSATCSHCGQEFRDTRGLFGKDALTLRDVHARGCRENPRNKCFCGRVFPNAAARDDHATSCEMNPVNNFKCPYCPQEFVTTYGWLASDGRKQRDAHAVVCKENPSNTCFCGQLFPNPDARNAHAAKCQFNPANCFKCRFCSTPYITTYNVFGFCSHDGMASRDVHEVVCEKNPKNKCFCGQVFPNPAAKEKHAMTCEENPANRFECPHCSRLFITQFGLMGMVVSDGKRLRDAHARGCQKNAANACFCGQLFANPEARDAHAVKCNMNPVNRFSCRHCREVFVTSFGMFTKSGSIERDAHESICRKNPANATCPHCQMTFVNSTSFLGSFMPDAPRRCREHSDACSKNPKNCFSCGNCNRCFVTRRRWLRKVSGKVARDEHQALCDVIPCDFEIKDAEVSEWQIVASPDAAASSSKTQTTDLDSDADGEPSVAASSVKSDANQVSNDGSFLGDESSYSGDESDETKSDASEREADDSDDMEEPAEEFQDAHSVSGDEPLMEAVEDAVLPVEHASEVCSGEEPVLATSLTASSVEDALAKVWEKEAFEVLG